MQPDAPRVVRWHGQEYEIVWNGTIDRQLGGALSSTLLGVAGLYTDRPMRLTLADEPWPFVLALQPSPVASGSCNS